MPKGKGTYGSKVGRPPKKKYQEGGPIEEQMDTLMPVGEEEVLADEKMMSQESVVPDEEMETDHMDFIISESLAPEDENYLLGRLEQDDRLSSIFDQVIETASEFSGAGSVEGPGTSVSDSIPARLSEGEFVMTAKAADEIGPDNLQGMMEQAEFEADDRNRRIMQAGGYVEEEVEDKGEQEIVQAVNQKDTAKQVMAKPFQDRKLQEAMIGRGLLAPRIS